MSAYFDWFQVISKLPIPPEWLATMGKEVKVAFADSGVNLSLPSLAHLNIGGRKFFTGHGGFSVAKLTGQDPVGEVGISGVGHGTLYASLLAGKTPVPTPSDKPLVNGVANAASYYIIKATSNSGNITKIKHILDALELSANLGIEIFITGQCISRSEMRFEGLSEVDIARVFNMEAVKRMFIFAPLKNTMFPEDWISLTTDNFPSMVPQIFNVAKLPNELSQFEAAIKTQNIPFLLSGFKGELLSQYGDMCTMNFSNSGATAIMGGISVLALSYFKAQNEGKLPDKEQFLQLLATCCQQLDNTIDPINFPTIFKNY